MQIDYPYSLEKPEALERLKILGEYLYNRHSISVTWDGDEATFDGKYLMIKIEGQLKVGDSRIHFEGRDPGVLLRKKATKYLTEKLEYYLDPSNPKDELPRRK
jgi:hypothetical protein